MRMPEPNETLGTCDGDARDAIPSSSNTPHKETNICLNWRPSPAPASQGHAGEGNCPAHGPYIGLNCPKWPECCIAGQKPSPAPAPAAQPEQRRNRRCGLLLSPGLWCDRPDGHAGVHGYIFGEALVLCDEQPTPAAQGDELTAEQWRVKQFGKHGGIWNDGRVEAYAAECVHLALDEHTREPLRVLRESADAAAEREKELTEALQELDNSFLIHTDHPANQFEPDCRRCNVRRLLAKERR